LTLEKVQDINVGHDGFLLEFVQMRALLSSFIRNQAPQLFLGEKEMDTNAPIEVKASVFGEAEGDLLAW
jgi:hypothetical protein